ncbi:hypothetical protein [Streptomyces misionensis]|uniref:hypothetical protein n=1 Tax=Streptomyces misionensis TaxID=67331 RepID=UPI0037023C5A
MSPDSALLTIHVLAALVMLASLSLDWIGVLRLRRASTLPHAHEGVTTLERSAAFGAWARLITLAAGLWLAIDAGHWIGWIIAGLAGWTALVLLGEPLTGKGLCTMVKTARKTDLVADALKTAASTRGGLDEAGFHSDHGAQYGSHAFVGLCDQLAVTRRWARSEPERTTRPAKAFTCP